MRSLRQSGFTLMEVLLVILLIGLAAAAVTYTSSSAGKQQELERTAKQFIATTELVLDETVLSGQFIGIVIDKSYYKFVYYEEGKWKPLEDDRLLAEREMPYGVEMSLILDGLPLSQEDEEDDSWFDEPLIELTEEEKKKFPEPQVMLFPSGEMSAFELTFVSKDEQGDEIDTLVVGDALGRLTLGRDDGFEDE
ncbi:type II secretion system minor pseudopilin GspH [Shewanella sp. AS1]|uniref:type II secretion system minor pseudopilin GspH n=1 Tax=Shewanella sp. AS1 TaxID=2907626 RepID=UPI001F231090|nr:type II secretion system minor pseudopilin GspH [Shewanella sp. AS1]MCE9680140.1 type II secretion system minor pseudopilin GspH [Shewanella sp. AS1]